MVRDGIYGRTRILTNQFTPEDQALEEEALEELFDEASIDEASTLDFRDFLKLISMLGERTEGGA